MNSLPVWCIRSIILRSVRRCNFVLRLSNCVKADGLFYFRASPTSNASSMRLFCAVCVLEQAWRRPVPASSRIDDCCNREPNLEEG